MNIFFYRKTWDCDTCIADVQVLSSYGQTPEAGAGIVATLQGPAFCQNPDLGLSGEELANCQTAMATADQPFALVYKKVGELAQDICTELYQIC